MLLLQMGGIRLGGLVWAAAPSSFFSMPVEVYPNEVPGLLLVPISTDPDILDRVYRGSPRVRQVDDAELQLQRDLSEPSTASQPLSTMTG